MGRNRRPNLPGALFHLAACTLDRKRLFTPSLRTAAMEAISRAVPTSGVRLLAVAIMPTHFHLVVQQGGEPVSRLMHPLLRNLAHLLQRERGIEGPVFWRPYACQPCMSPSHARNAIVYVNLNPVRANLCADASTYPWTSHHAYARGAGKGAISILHGVIEPLQALPLFATAPDRTTDQLRSDYRRHVQWRLALDRQRSESSLEPVSDDEAESPWESGWGNLHWERAFNPLFHSPAAARGFGDQAVAPGARPDMATIARATLVAEGSRLPLAQLRGRGGSVEHIRLRHAMIERMHVSGHQNVKIARFLGISESAVSKVVCARRAAPTS
jgi:REP element-mobilizing transposase RayT